MNDLLPILIVRNDFFSSCDLSTVPGISDQQFRSRVLLVWVLFWSGVFGFVFFHLPPVYQKNVVMGRLIKKGTYYLITEKPSPL